MAETPVAPPRRAVSPAPGDPAPARRGGLLRDAALAVNLQVTRKHPVSLVHFVTRRCNARCSFCFIDFDNPSPKSAELSAEEIDQLTRSLGPHLQNVNLTGGEPFLRGDLPQIVGSYYRNTPVRSVYITSNGAFTDRTLALAEQVATTYPDRLLIVSLSLDAFPDEHDRIRKVPGLFEKALATYRALRAMGGNVLVNVGITVSHENHQVVPALYEHLIDLGVRSITAIIVRDEGVYATPVEQKEAIAGAYRWLTNAIGRDQEAGRLEGYDPATLQGRLMNAKNEVLWDIVADTYVDPRYVSPCHAGRLFGIIDADGTVHPCEVLDRPLGNLRDHGLDLGALWHSSTTGEVTSWIRETRCNCSYECAWGFNIAGNLRYQPRLLRAALGR